MKTDSNTNIYLEDDETQQQNTGSDAGLKWKHNLDHKKAVVGDKEKVSVAGVNNNQAKKRHEPTNTFDARSTLDQRTFQYPIQIHPANIPMPNPNPYYPITTLTCNLLITTKLG